MAESHSGTVCATATPEGREAFIDRQADRMAELARIQFKGMLKERFKSEAEIGAEPVEFSLTIKLQVG